jgi:hypothetical protein
LRACLQQQQRQQGRWQLQQMQLRCTFHLELMSILR